LVADLGGREALSTQQVSLIELAVRTRLMLDSIDSWILSQPSLVDKRRRALLPVVRERASLATAFRELLRDLGLERRAKPVMTLAEILASDPKEAPREESPEVAATGEEVAK